MSSWSHATSSSTRSVWARTSSWREGTGQRRASRGPGRRGRGGCAGRMGPMSTGYWDQVQAAGFEVPPTGRSTTSPPSSPRCSAPPTRGPRRHRLPGAGDLDRPRRLRRPARRPRRRDGRRAVRRAGRARHRHGLPPQLQRADPRRVPRARQRRSTCSRAARCCEWGDRLATWFLTERDTRGFVPGKGWAHAVAHGADAIGALGESPHLAGAEHAVCSTSWPSGSSSSPPTSRSPRASRTGSRTRPCASCAATPLGVDVARAVGAPASVRPATPSAAPSTTTPSPRPAAPQAFLRALFVQLSLAPDAARRCGPTCCSWSSRRSG